jgi:heme exporter protein D
MTMPDHFDFIAASYAAAVVVIAVLVAWVTLDYRAQRRTLADLETRGVTRRSAPAPSEPPMQRAKEQA